ncbi:MAG: kynureninase [Flammeovirgaceae bacterium]|nr:kynureninase [Flammeovirgaceae bacterium]
MIFQKNLQFAKDLDFHDPLKDFKSEFYFPVKNKKPVIYFCGNSLGLQPKKAKDFIEKELAKWKKLAVDGHFEQPEPWVSYHRKFLEVSCKLLGATPLEIAIMNSLTVNLHLMLVSFYQPTNTRFKIIMEGGAFPSDQYAIASQVEFHAQHLGENLSFENTIIELFPRKGEDILRTEDLIKAIKNCGDELALVIMGGVNYYTGQAYDMEAITSAGQEVGAFVGFDLAHAAGNILLNLHKWNTDFAVWCSYKYLNSGPGSTSGVFIHENHAENFKIPRFAGWWGHNQEERFLMEKKFKPMAGAEGWMQSNSQIFSIAPYLPSLEIFDKAGIDNLFEKSRKLTGYLEFLVNEINIEKGKEVIKILTPKTPKDRGCQLSLVFLENGKKVFEELTNSGIVSDWREPDVIRIAPVPLYNSFSDVFQFYNVVRKII